MNRAAVLILLLVLSTCTPGPPQGDARLVLRVGWKGSPDTLNPGTAVLAEAYTLFELVYDSLYDLELDGTFRLSLAERVESSADGRTWTFHLRPGIAFHDGHPLSAADVAFSYRLYREHADFPYLNTYTRHFGSIEAPDSLTVVLRLDEPVPNLPSRLVFLYVLPAHLWAAPAEGNAAADFGNEAMVGSGPFRLLRYRQNEYVQLAANPGHFAFPPRIREAIFQTYHNEDALVQALRTGQVDMITELPNTAVRALNRDPVVRFVQGAPFSPEATDIAINQLAPEHCPREEGGRCTGHPALRDPVVRRALAQAVDKRTLIDVVLLGLGTPGLTLIPDGLGDWFNRSLTDLAHDPETSRRILDEAGYRDRDGDGIREVPGDGRPLIFRLNWPNDLPEAPRMAELLAQMWRQIGIGTRLQAVDPDALTAQCCPAFDYDLMIWSWDSDPDPNLLLGVMTSREIPTGTSESGYSNPAYDLLFEEQSRETDPVRRHELVWRLQQLAFDDVVYIVPYYARARQAYRVDRFQGWIVDQPRLALEDVSSLVRIEPVVTAAVQQ